MTELEIIRLLKQNDKPFRDLPVEAQEWAKAHWKGTEYLSRLDDEWHEKRHETFSEDYVYRLRSDYPEASRAELIEEGKKNRVPWKWLPPEMRAVMESVGTKSLVRMDHWGAWIENPNPTDGCVIRIHESYTEPAPEPEPKMPPIVKGFQTRCIEGMAGVYVLCPQGGE